MYYLLAFITTGYAAAVPLSNLRSDRLSNSLSPNGNDEGTFFQFREWVKISEAPPKIVNEPLGSRIELECEAVGSPAPTIQWVKGTSPLTENESYESNMIAENINRGLSKIKSRLIINGLLPMHQGPISCVATSGLKSAMAVTTLIASGKVPIQKNFSDYLSSNMITLAHPRVRIVLFNTVIMEPMHSDIILPCKTVGTPKPDIYWIDNNNQQIISSSEDSRIKVMSDGELRIQDLSWSDMGGYICVARNDYSKDSINTFVYPILNEN